MTSHSEEKKTPDELFDQSVDAIAMLLAKQIVEKKPDEK